MMEINIEDVHYADIIHTDSFYESLAASKNIKVPYFHGIFLHNECAICGEEFEEGSMVLELSCKHIFHFKCSHFWFKEKTSCAICRKQVAFAQKIYIKWSQYTRYILKHVSQHPPTELIKYRMTACNFESVSFDSCVTLAYEK
ncbi:hypothetical protein HELRODRAFT_169591 [Helobdella robusta]|uniref:RING-type domain-containing protein n=1 Tax=Helobdella robusta TaxID=6412 RepID=T1F252_HELRO|nr:hypothetical protein HELRODRAFT_169591 [Helobdella robusta]ESO07891.1 hypothetical protein HELRODRAFT_169591 [Helobdella robusta]